MDKLETKLTKVFEDIIERKFNEYGKEQKRLEEERKEMFESHQSIIRKLISDNNILMNQRLDKIYNEINELKSSIETTDTVVLTHTKDIKDIKTKLKTVKTNETAVRNLQELTENVKEKLIDLENRSRRNNLRIDGVPESQNETWKDCQEKIKTLFTNELKLKDKINIERAHRTGKSTSEKPKTIVIKLLSYQDKTLILKNAKRLRGSGIYINEDFAKETVEKRKRLWEEVKQHRRDGRYAVLQYDKIIVRNHKTRFQA